MVICKDIPYKKKKKKKKGRKEKERTKKYLHNLANPIHSQPEQDFLLFLHGFPSLLNEVPCYLAEKKKKKKLKYSLI